MTSDAPIGIFDSGVGGLTVAKALIDLLPNESFVYFADTEHVPYGDRSPQFVRQLTFRHAQFLVDQGIKLLVVACNTASAHAGQQLKEHLPIPVIEVIRPSAEKAAEVSQGNIAVLATRGTVRSGIYRQELERCCPMAKVFSKACPLFVPAVEEGLHESKLAEMIVKEALEDLAAVDTVLLGCTHYPLLQPVIRRVMGSTPRIVNSADACAKAVAAGLAEMGLEARSNGKATYQCYATDNTARFKEMVQMLFNLPFRQVGSPKQVCLQG